MDNYNHNHNTPYQYVYRYPYGHNYPCTSTPQNQQSQPYNHHNQPYHVQYYQYTGHPSSHSYPYPYPYPYLKHPGPRVNTSSSEYSTYHYSSHSSPVLFQYHQQHQNSSALPEPSIKRQSSFQHGPNRIYYRQHSRPLRPPESLALEDNVSVRSANVPSYTSIYPPNEDCLSYMHSAPASPHAPSEPLDNDNPPSGSDVNYSGEIVSPKPHPYLKHSISYVDPVARGHQSRQVVQYTTSKDSLKLLLLHGNLDIWIYEARNLPNMDLFYKAIGEVLNKLPGKVGKLTSDPYVSISVTTAVIGRTYVIPNNENPSWMQHFYVPVAHYAAEVHFFVKDNDILGSQLMGIVSIPVEKIHSGGQIQGHFPVINTSGKPAKPGAQLSLSIQYTPIEKLTKYHNGVEAGPDYQGVPSTYFPLRKGGIVTLYQDAHIIDDNLPKFQLEDGMPYVHGKCWHDIFHAIREARHLIYIAGWSVWHKVQLVRDSSVTEDCSTLGELLKAKSQEGVRVLLLLWDDPTSRNIMGYKTDGLMQTHDEETRRYFKHSSVQVLLCPRVAGKRHSWVKKKEVGTIYTHHQKTVLVDTAAGDYKRKIIAFLGGLDLCDGRYDTPHHPIFSTLQTVHKDDYHNPTFAVRVGTLPGLNPPNSSTSMAIGLRWNVSP
ncbi:hypothetical protein AgCh_034180 [Apium graveolens]